MPIKLVIFGNPPADAAGLAVCLPDGIAEITACLSGRDSAGNWTAHRLSTSPDGGVAEDDHDLFLIDLTARTR